MSNDQKQSLQWLFRSVFLVAAIGAATNALAADTLIVNQYMKPNQHLTSANGKYRLSFQSDGNVILRRESDQAQLWASNSANRNGKRLVLGWDGNLTVRNHGKSPAWTSNTQGCRANRLKLNDDGNVVMYDTANRQIWSTNTAQTDSVKLTLAPPVSYVGSNSLSILRTNQYSTFNLTRPAATRKGDLLVLVVATDSGTTKMSHQYWTFYRACTVHQNTDTSCSSNNSGGDLGIAIFYRYASTDGAVTYTFNRTAGSETKATIMTFRDTAKSSPFFSSQIALSTGVSSSGAATNTLTCPSTSTPNFGAAACVFMHDDPEDKTFSPNWTQVAETIDGDSAMHILRFGQTNGSNSAPVTGTGPDVATYIGNGIQIAFSIRPF